MPSPRAPHRYGQPALPLPQVKGQQKIHQPEKPLQKLPALRRRHHVVPHRRLQPRVLPQLRHVKRVRQAPHVKHQVRLHGQPVLEPKGDALHRHPLGRGGQEGLHHPLPQLGRGGQAGVEHQVRLLPGLGQQLPLLADSVLDGQGAALQQGVPPPALFIPPQQRLVVGVQKEQPEGIPLLPQPTQGPGEVPEHLPAPGVHHQRHPLGAPLGGPPQLGEFLQHLGRDVVHAEVPQILQGIDDLGFSRPRKAGHDDKLHFASPLPVVFFNYSKRARGKQSFSPGRGGWWREALCFCTGRGERAGYPGAVRSGFGLRPVRKGSAYRALARGAPAAG